VTGINSKTHQRVAVVLCTWRAGPHLEAQLDSLAAQDWPHAVLVYDDASGDGTSARARRHPGVTDVFDRPANLGFVQNFAAGIADAVVRGFDYIALADQDDVWQPTRLRDGMVAILAAERLRGRDHPLLVHSDLRLIDAAGRHLHASFIAWRGYATAGERDLPVVLGQCGAMGNTMLCNVALARLALPFPPGLFVHDWWLALLAELWGTRLFLPQPTVDYRLHADNASNSMESTRRDVRSRLVRLGLDGLLARDFRLPFKEDSRADVLDALLTGDGHRPRPEGADRNTIVRFVSYLRLRGPRPALLASMLRGGYVRRGFLHRCRFAIALLVSRRYAASAGSTEGRRSTVQD